MKNQRQILVLSIFAVSGRSLCAYLAGVQPDYRVIFKSCLDSDSLPPDFSPEVVILYCGACDPSCPGIVSMSLHAPAKFIVIARSPGRRLQIEWLNAGIRGLIDETDSSDVDIQRAIRSVLAGEVWAPRKLLSEMLASIPAKTDRNGVAALTPRETAITILLQDGLKNATIGSQLDISERTVKGHLTSIYRKLGVKNRTQAAIRLRRANLKREP